MRIVKWRGWNPIFRWMAPITWMGLAIFEGVLYYLHRDNLRLYLCAFYFYGSLLFTYFNWRLANKEWALKPKKSRNLKSPHPNPSLSQLQIAAAQLRLHPNVLRQRQSSQLRSPSPRKVPNPVVGFRVWSLVGVEWVDGGNPFLTHSRAEARVGCLSAINPQYGSWQPGVNAAICKGAHDGTNWISNHPAPGEGCHCGFWIKNSIDGALRHKRAGMVMGVVMGWGRVWEHEDGWRAQYASVLALAVEPAAPSGMLDVVGMKLSDEGIKNLIFKQGLKFDVPVLATHEKLQKWYLENTTK